MHNHSLHMGDILNYQYCLNDTKNQFAFLPDIGTRN